MVRESDFKIWFAKMEYLMKMKRNYSSNKSIFYHTMVQNTESKNGLFPVAVLIHGGGFQWCSAVDFGYEFLTEHYVIQAGIVLITIQYRLGVLGT